MIEIKVKCKSEGCSNVQTFMMDLESTNIKKKKMFDENGSFANVKKTPLKSGSLEWRCKKCNLVQTSIYKY